MRSIYKYQLSGYPGAVDTLQMPEGAKILSVGEQKGSMCVWALVEPSASPTPRKLIILGTGWELKDAVDDMIFIGRITIGQYEWHIFEVPSK